MSERKIMSSKDRIDTIKVIWATYCDVILDGYACQIDEILEEQGCSSCAIKTITDKMRAFRHEFYAEKCPATIAQRVRRILQVRRIHAERY